jgi:regulator of cell morphogenesis and NO signaling
MNAKERELEARVSIDDLYEIVVARFEEEKNYLKQVIHDISPKTRPDLGFLIEILIAFEDTAMLSTNRLLEFPLPVIVNYLKKTHQYYIRRRLMEIEQSFHHLLQYPQSQQPIVQVLHVFFKQYAKELVEHIEMEEKDLLPYVEFLIESEKTGACLGDFYAANGKYSLDQFSSVHDDGSEQKLDKIQEELANISPDLASLLPFKILHTQLAMFRKDLQIHAWVEEHVLLPKAKLIEVKLK